VQVGNAPNSVGKATNCTSWAMYHPRMHSAPDLAAFILAGGKSTRMGTDKAFVEFEGRTLLARALDLTRSVTLDVRIVGDPAKFGAFAPVVEDIFSGCGPLAGIHAALRSSSADLNLILAIDLPFVSLALLQYLVTRARNSADARVTIANDNGGLQPLAAIYRREFAEAAEKALQQGRYKIDVLFESATTQIIPEPELEAAGFSPRIFRNLNTPQDLAEARK